MQIITELINGLHDDRQKQAVRKFHRTVILAGPGSGKTFTLVLKVAFLLGQIVNSPQRIACVTYMNDAVREIENRLSTLGFEDDERLFVGTVHKFCIMNIIKPFKDIFLHDWADVIRIADEEKQLECLMNGLERAYVKLPVDEKELDEKLRELLEAINQHRVAKLFGEESDNEVLAKVVDIYLQSLRDNGFVDFKDIEIASCELIQTQEVVRNYMACRFPWLIIDEYQDLGRIFNTLVTHLVTNTQINFFVVGDENQSIMGFQGADPSYLSQISRLTDVEIVNLKITLRCSQHIVNAANLLLPAKSEKIITLYTEITERNIVCRKCAGGTYGEIKYTINIINKLRERDIPLGEIAVLCRQRSTIARFIEQFDEAGIKYSGERDGRYPRTPFTRWLEDMAAWLRTGWQSGTPKFSRIYREFKKFIGLLQEQLFDNLTELEFRTLFFDTLWSRKDTSITVREWITYLIENLKIDYIATQLRIIEPYQADSFFELFNATSMGEKLESMTVADLALCGRSEDSVFLSTVHSSKGLEFDYVIIPELLEDRFPIYRATDISEERRLLYVGITRARKNVALLYSDYFITRQEKEFPKKPSRFLKELGLLTR